MILKNNKIIGDHDTMLDKCIKYLPREILEIVANFHHCSNCVENNYIHCNNCGECVEKYNKHNVCSKCNICYPYMRSITFANRRYDYILNKHIHCDICDRVKKYSMIRYAYYCENCY